MKTLNKIFVIGAAALTTSAPSNAATQAANMNVNASIAGTCTIGATTLNFGQYAGTQTDVTTTVAVQCTNLTAYTVGMANGNNFSTSRRMTAGAGNFLTYGLYQDVAHATPWGNAAGSWVAGTGNGTSQTLNIYGSMPSGQSAAVGTYNDTVVMTITY